MRPVIAKDSRADLEILRQMIEDGSVTPIVDRTYALTEAPDAVRYLELGHAAGKVVVTI
jgi:NADPH:quinone reductase-like Zn-dependent oxidoreductase